MGGGGHLVKLCQLIMHAERPANFHVHSSTLSRRSYVLKQMADDYDSNDLLNRNVCTRFKLSTYIQEILRHCRYIPPRYLKRFTGLKNDSEKHARSHRYQVRLLEPERAPTSTPQSPANAFPTISLQAVRRR